MPTAPARHESPAPPATTPEPSTLSVVADLNRRIRDELGERVLDATSIENPLLGLDRSQILAAGARVGLRALAEPGVTLRRTGRLASELGAIALGRSERTPEKGDRRFVDETWRDHPGYRRWMQAYLAWREAVTTLVDELDLDPKSRARGRFFATLATEAVAPTNTLVGNPSALKRAFETGGLSLWKGFWRLVDDVRTNGGMPRQVNAKPFEVGRNLAVTPGAVVFRNEVLELLEYAASTPETYERPIVLVPPQVNKFYVLDLAPGRSLVEHLVGRGLHTFVVSWRNPTPAQRDWGLDRYVGALVEALDAVEEITGAEKVNLFGACAGGITTAILLGHLAARGDDRVVSATFPVTLLDTEAESPLSTFASERSLASALSRSRKAGILAGREMARVFAWLRPNDLVWNYWANNYLLGNAPPAFDVLYWNADSTNLPAQLHAEFLDLFLGNRLLHPGSLEVLDTPIDLGQVTADVYAVGGSTDHITPWKGVFRTPQAFGGRKTFVRSSSGHVQALVNPPGNVKSRYVTRANGLDLDPEAWLATAKEHRGTWWSHWTTWLARRSGAKRPAPRAPGSERHPPITAAPGRYVHQVAD